MINEHRDNCYHRRSCNPIWRRRRLLVFKTEVSLPLEQKHENQKRLAVPFAVLGTSGAFGLSGESQL
jgi:hypothetical protein